MSSISGVPTTPRARSFAADPTTPVGSRISTSAASALQSSPHYATTRRHSLYGTEDRIVLDPGSRVWKAGFSGEGRPRDVFFIEEGERTALWGLERSRGSQEEQEEEEQMLKVKLQDRLRRLFHEVLLTDPKSRKVIIVEHPMLPLHIKEILAGVLFDNLQVPSISFISSHVLALLAVGRMTGLVVDCGYLETTVLPMFASRPLFPQLKSTPLAGSRYTSHLRALILMFATYVPPLSTLSGAANIPAASRSMRVPEEILTDAVMEDIKARCCFVGEIMEDTAKLPVRTADVDDSATEPEVPQSDSSAPGGDSGVNSPGTPPSSRLSSVTSPSGYSALTRALSGSGSGPHVSHLGGSGERHLQAISDIYAGSSDAKEISIRVDPPPGQAAGTGRGTLRIPGWVRGRAAEVLFANGDVDESSVAEVILDALLRVPVDLRKTLAASILVVGGTAMLPGFIPRLQNELVRLLPEEPKGPRTPRPSDVGESSPTRRIRRPRPVRVPYATLRSLRPYIAILNNPSPPQLVDPNIPSNAGKAPAFTPALLPWVGGSLAGSLKIGGWEVSREKWDEAATEEEVIDEETQEVFTTIPAKRTAFHLPDWTRSPLPHGAPPAPRPPRPEHALDIQ